MSSTMDQNLPPPKFELPDDFFSKPDDYELWSIRTPVKFDLSVLDGSTLQLENIHDASKNDRRKTCRDKSSKGELENKTDYDVDVTKFQIDDKTYSLSKANEAEVKSFRILMSAKDIMEGKVEGENDTLKNKEGMEMKVLPVRFSKHFTIVQTSNTLQADIDLAPSFERAPSVDMKEMKMRIPYTPIDQVKGLKRRWQAIGANALYIPPKEGRILPTANNATGESTTKDSDNLGKEAGENTSSVVDSMHESLKSPKRQKRKKQKLSPKKKHKSPKKSKNK